PNVSARRTSKLLRLSGSCPACAAPRLPQGPLYTSLGRTGGLHLESPNPPSSTCGDERTVGWIDDSETTQPPPGVPHPTLPAYVGGRVGPQSGDRGRTASPPSPRRPPPLPASGEGSVRPSAGREGQSICESLQCSLNSGFSIRVQTVNR